MAQVKLPTGEIINVESAKTVISLKNQGATVLPDSQTKTPAKPAQKAADAKEAAK